MATNQAISGPVFEINEPVPAAALVNAPVLVGSLAGVVLALQPLPTPLSPTTATIDIGRDAYNLSVLAATTISPLAGSAIKPGDKLYADGGTLDATTNVTTGFTIDKNSSGTYFGNALDAVGSGLTATIRVRLKMSGA